MEKAIENLQKYGGLIAAFKNSGISEKLNQYDAEKIKEVEKIIEKFELSLSENEIKDMINSISNDFEKEKKASWEVLEAKAIKMIQSSNEEKDKIIAQMQTTMKNMRPLPQHFQEKFAVDGINIVVDRKKIITIKKVLLTGDSLTTPLKNPYSENGIIRIKFYWTGKEWKANEFYAFYKKDKKLQYFPHYNISDSGKICLGDISNMSSEIVLTTESIDNAVTKIVKLLETVYPESSYHKMPLSVKTQIEAM